MNKHLFNIWMCLEAVNMKNISKQNNKEKTKNKEGLR